MAHTDNLITCPHCHTEFPISSAIAGPIRQAAERELEKKAAEMDADYFRRGKAIAERELELSKLEQEINLRVSATVAEEREKITQVESQRAQLFFRNELDQKAKELSHLQEVINERDAKLVEAQNLQVETLRKQRDLDDARREVDLNVQKGIQEGLAAARELAKKNVEEDFQLKLNEKEQLISSMNRQIQDLKNKSEQGSQQLQGEVLELELETMLTSKFPMDTIYAVPKGECGGDLIHIINGPYGESCGTILWESKRTKHWSDGWLAKLRDDQRNAKAEIAILVSQTTPKNLLLFEQIDGVWVTHPRSALALSIALRHALIETFLARRSSDGQQTKKELVYQYLTGPLFRQRVEAIGEAFNAMKEDLVREKKFFLKQFSKREMQLESVMSSTVGLYGDLQGIAGKSLQEIEWLEVPLFDQPGRIEMNENEI